MTAEPDLLEIAPALYRLRIPGSDAHLLNSYLWLGPDEVALFDTGWASSAAVIAAALVRLGRSPSDVGHVVLSHFHEDHAGAAAKTSTWPNSVIVAGATESSVISGAEGGPLPRFSAAERTIHDEPSEPPRARACRVELQVAGGTNCR